VGAVVEVGEAGEGGDGRGAGVDGFELGAECGERPEAREESGNLRISENVGELKKIDVVGVGDDAQAFAVVEDVGEELVDIEVGMVGDVDAGRGVIGGCRRLG
jgi:hypothetical protein